MVRWLHAARNTSGADEWLYSSRKWCSTSQTYWMPERIGELDLVERVLDQLVLGAVVPGTADLVLVEDAEPFLLPAAATGDDLIDLLV